MGANSTVWLTRISRECERPADDDGRGELLPGQRARPTNTVEEYWVRRTSQFAIISSALPVVNTRAPRRERADLPGGPVRGLVRMELEQERAPGGDLHAPAEEGRPVVALQGLAASDVQTST
jgi:hypothetical protein